MSISSRPKNLDKYPPGGTGTVVVSIPSRSGRLAGCSGNSGGSFSVSLTGARTYRMNRLFGCPLGIVIVMGAMVPLSAHADSATGRSCSMTLARYAFQRDQKMRVAATARCGFGSTWQLFFDALGISPPCVRTKG